MAVTVIENIHLMIGLSILLRLINGYYIINEAGIIVFKTQGRVIDLEEINRWLKLRKGKKESQKNSNKKDIRRIPCLTLRGLTVFPYMVLHFDVGREKSIAALERL